MSIYNAIKKFKKLNFNLLNHDFWNFMYFWNCLLNFVWPVHQSLGLSPVYLGKGQLHTVVHVALHLITIVWNFEMFSQDIKGFYLVNVALQSSIEFFHCIFSRNIFFKKYIFHEIYFEKWCLFQDKNTKSAANSQCFVM